MAPVIHCVRHGQGLHNVQGNYSLSDPRLTTFGKEQCEALRRSSFPDQSNISAVVASPLCRALETAFLTFQPALTSGRCVSEIVALTDAQETSDDACDVGSDVPLLKNTIEANNWPVNTSLVQNGWNVKTHDSRYSPDSAAIEARARSARLFLRDLARRLVKDGIKDPQIVLVTHGTFLHYFTQDWEDSHRNPGTGWQNCETRSYVFQDDFLQSDDDEGRLQETKESRSKRGLDHPMYAKSEQTALYHLAMRSWEAQGLQNPHTVLPLTIN